MPGRPDRPAVVWESEDGTVERVTYGELGAETNRLANALLELGVGRGDAVGLFLPMSIQVVAGFYAIAQDRRDRRADLLRASPRRRSRPGWPTPARWRCSPPTRCRGAGGPSSMKAIADDAVADGADRARTSWCGTGSGTDPPMTAGRDHRWDELVGRGRAPSCARPRSTPRRR